MQALGNKRRLQILEWLKEPERHFPPQVDGDLVKDGVCGLLISRKLRVSQPAVTDHLKILLAGWICYQQTDQEVDILQTRREEQSGQSKSAISRQV